MYRCHIKNEEIKTLSFASIVIDYLLQDSGVFVGEKIIDLPSYFIFKYICLCYFLAILAPKPITC